MLKAWRAGIPTVETKRFAMERDDGLLSIVRTVVDRLLISLSNPQSRNLHQWIVESLCAGDVIHTDGDMTDAGHETSRAMVVVGRCHEGLSCSGLTFISRNDAGELPRRRGTVLFAR
jgi:hypothetical protein